MKLKIKLSQDDLEDIEAYFGGYLQIFKSDKEHREYYKKHKKEVCVNCERVKELLKKIKKIQPDDLVSLKEVGKQIK